MKHDFLEELGIEETNPGACWGPDGWIDDPDARTIKSISPIDGETIARVRLCSARDLDNVLAKAQDAFERWRMMPAPKRGELVRVLGEELRKKKDPLGKLVTLEMGKIVQEGWGEVQEMIDVCDFAVGLSRQLYGKSMHSERPLHRMYEQWHPLGIVGVISAFNFPVAVWSWNAAIAAVCGDTTVWKPSSDVPLCAVAVQHICNEVMAKFDLEGIFSYVVGPGREVGENLISDPRVRLVSATGSTPMGQRVAEVVSKRLGRTILELGGNNAVLVDGTADLEMAVRAVLFGAVGTAGQRCTTTRRVIIDRRVSDEFTDRLVKAYESVPIGDPLDEANLMGPLVHHGAIQDMANALEKVREQGGQVVYGGEPIEGPGWYVHPCIVRIRGDAPIVREETFAPVLYIIDVGSVEEAIAVNNMVPQGLSSAMFTTNLQNAEAWLSHAGSDCGIANVNIGTSGAEIGGAFGGEKDTGGGRESGSDSWKQYMRRQTCTVNWGKELPLAQGIRFGDD
jgi:aldehyde dehydrogenase (NAD+)